MTGSAPTLPVDLTGQLAQSIPGFDPTPTINAGDRQLTDYLAMPTQQILDQLGLPRLPGPALAAAGMPAHPGGPITPADPIGLISPVFNALSTLGTGNFSGMDPTGMLHGISNAFDGAAGPVQQALGAVQQGWQGASSAAAGAKTAAALANGAQVATQATGLKTSLASAAADVAQARTQLIEIINEYLATLAAIGPMIIFPWGWAAVVAAAAKAVAHTTQVMTQVQSSLAAQAGAVSAIGTPVNVTAAPQLGASGAGPLSSLGAGPLSSLLGGSASSTGPMGAMNMLSPLMYGASAGISPAMSAASMAGGAGSPAGATGATTAALAGAAGADPKAAAGGAALAGRLGGAAGSVSPAGGGSAASGGALVSRVTAPMSPSASETTTAAMAAAATRPATGGMPVGGAGMMGAPLAGAAGAASAGGAHTAASYLHTSDQGGKVVGDRYTVAPPVIGELDPTDTPDIELRI
jgi:hypothetical protein